MSVPYTRTPTSLTVVMVSSGFRPVVIPSSHPNFQTLTKLVTDPATTEAQITPLLDIPSAIASFTGDEIKVVNGRLFYRGSEVKDNLAKVILDFVKSGDPAAAQPFRKFLANCRQNPDLALVSTIYDWCVKGGLPITPEGELIAWKIVGPDFKSIHSGKRGKLDHSIGAVVTEPREECDPNRNQTCSTGIHFCSIEYLQSGGYGGGLTGRNKVIAVVINPADVTAIPTDYNLTKGRCCKLRVVGEVEGLRAPDYYGSAKVFSGWSAAPVVRVELPVRAGDKVRLRSGETGTVSVHGDGSVAGINGRKGDFYVATGRAFSVKPRDSDSDVVETLTRAPATPRNAHGFAVGQTVKLRNGSERKITSISAGGTYSVRDDMQSVYTASGRFNDERSTSQLDIVRIVKDVA